MSNWIYKQDETEHERRAFELGQEAGRAAASWIVDGNTSTEHIARMVAWLDDGDPRADDYLPPMPNLSGEWADAPTPARLFEEVTRHDAHAEATWNHDAYQTVLEGICDAWEAGVSDTFQTECERILRAAMPEDDMTCGHCGRTWNSVLTPTPAARCPYEYEHEYDDDDDDDAS